MLVGAAPEGHEGGNTRYAAQAIETARDFAQIKKYCQQITAPMTLDPEMIDTFVQAMVNIPTYVTQYLGANGLFVWRKNFGYNNNSKMILG